MFDAQPRPALRPSPVTSWSSFAFADRERYDAWVHALSDFFLPWTVTSRGDPAFAAVVRQRRLRDARLIYCASDPVAGERRTPDLGRTSGDYFNLLYLASGAERLKFDGRELLLRPGQFVLWDSQRPMSFDVMRPIEKLTLMIPERALRAVLPRAADCVGIAVDGTQGLGAIFVQHLQSLARQVWSMSESEVEPLLAPTLELLAGCYHGAAAPRPSVRAMLFERVRAYALQRLADPALTPRRLAEAHRISPRYLQLLFADAGTTASEWIRGQRLERCRQALGDPRQAALSVSEIAYRWGFQDLGHFGKAFRRAYGCAPREFRRQGLS